MRRDQLDHVLRAAWAITGTADLVVIGSQAILGSVTNPPEPLVVSMEADIVSLHDPNDADLIDGSIGELSPFHETFGYYAHGVDEGTATFPQGWRDRLVRVLATADKNGPGWCLAPVDIAVTKVIAGREKDMGYVRALLDHRLVAADEVERMLRTAPITRDLLELRCAWLRRAT